MLICFLLPSIPFLTSIYLFFCLFFCMFISFFLSPFRNVCIYARDISDVHLRLTPCMLCTTGKQQLNTQLEPYFLLKQNISFSAKNNTKRLIVLAHRYRALTTALLPADVTDISRDILPVQCS